jgi:serine/threonine protein kinase
MQLTVTENQQFEQSVARFEQAWHAGGRPSLEDFLPAGGSLRGTLLTELVAIDLEFRQQRGERCTVADYQRQFPELIAEHACQMVPPPAAMPETFGRYKIIKRLGQGGMGEVYLAHDTQLDRQVALKIPKFSGADSAELIKRFYREARAAATLRHPNVCPVFDVGEIDGRHYLTMAYIDGRPLTELIQQLNPPSERQAATVIRKLALGMAEAHAQGVIHRDLKPANVMIDRRGEPVIMDFGLARRSSLTQSTSTLEGTLLGTPAYMSPEQVEADPRQIGPQSDIYSLGVILYELLTSQLPFEGDLVTLLTRIGQENPPPPSSHRRDLDRRLEAICLKMMARRRQDRYASMQEVARALSDYLKSSGIART